VNLALVDGEIDALEDLFVFDVDVEILDLEHRGFLGHVCRFLLLAIERCASIAPRRSTPRSGSP